MLLKIFTALILVYLSMGIGVYLSEHARPNSNIKSLSEAFWFPLITLTTIGYGDYYPVSGLGRAITGVSVIAGLGLMATMLSELPNLAIQRSQRREKGLVRIKVKNHAIICYWHEETPSLICELLAGETPIKDIIVISPGERPFEAQPHWHFVRGNPSEEKILHQANVSQARAVIAFPPQKEVLREAEISDSLSLMLQNTVRQIAPKAWRAVFLQREENRKHFESIGTNAINPDRLGVTVMVQSLQDPGVETVIRRLLSNLDGNTLFRTKLPKKFAGQEFKELYKISTWIPIAIIRAGHIIENPAKGTILHTNDDIIVIAPNRPKVV